MSIDFSDSRLLKDSIVQSMGAVKRMMADGDESRELSLVFKALQEALHYCEAA